MFPSNAQILEQKTFYVGYALILLHVRCVFFVFLFIFWNHVIHIYYQKHLENVERIFYLHSAISEYKYYSLQLRIFSDI